VSVRPATTASAQGSGVVLVIDTSRSMRGNPARDAMAAARAFAERREPSQKLGVVTFNDQSVVALPLTRDAGAIQQVLSEQPALGRETHIFDAVGVAVRMAARAHLRPASVVVLSDGSDTGSQTSSRNVVAAARNAGIRIFSVGLRSGAFDPRSLSGLASATHGVYRETSRPSDLKGIFDDLGTRLAHEYYVSYRSLAGPNAHVRVSVTVDGVPGAGTAEYTTPRLQIHTAPYQTFDFWNSAGAVVLVSLLVSALLVATIYFAFSRPERRRLHRRLSHFVSPAPAEQPIEDKVSGVAAPSLVAGFGRVFIEMSWWPKFEEELDVAGIKMQATQLAGATVLGTLALLALIATVTGSFLIGLVALLTPLAVRRFLQFKLQRERRVFGDQLADNLQVISSALRAGHSLAGAMSVAVDDAPEPTRREFGRVVADEKLGIPLENGLSVVARRMASRDLEQVVLVASLQRETGGNTAEVLDRVADTLRERAELRRMVRTLTAQGRMSRWIVTALPVVLTLAILALNPSYLSPLFNTAAGHALIVLGVVLLVSGSMAIKKIVTIEI
jgi:tight adherence protein B